MKISYQWLSTYFKEPLPTPKKVAELLTYHSFEVEGISPSGSDFIFDVKVLPNRTHDCLSHLGIARELGILLKTPLYREPLREKLATLNKSGKLEIIIDTKKVKRFSAIVIENIIVKTSPQWLKEKLEAIGQKSINNIVDATNYVMFDLGQPLHAFDKEKLIEINEKVKIGVRESKINETAVTLDGKSYQLPTETVLITDGNSGNKNTLGIAGIKGGGQAEITAVTKNIIIEAANFNAESIRRSSKLLGLRTEASVRFENGLAPELPSFALSAVASLILKIASTKSTKIEGFTEIYPKIRRSYKIGISVKEVNKILGTALKKYDIEKILKAFNFKYKEVKPIPAILKLGNNLVGAPYKYGASVTYDAPKLFDCSGLILFLFSEAGVYIPRVSIDQYIFGTEVGENELSPGDLIFSAGSSEPPLVSSVVFMAGKAKAAKGVNHVGLYLGNGNVLHASGLKNQGKVLIEELKLSNDFKSIVGYRRVIEEEEKRFVIDIPFERLDLKRREDLIEEIGRIYGLNKIPSGLFKKLKRKVPVNKLFFYATKARQILTSLGFSEVYTYALVEAGEMEIENPIAANKRFLRTSLKEGVERSLDLNLRNAPLLGLDEIKIFEIGTVFNKNGSEYLSLSIGADFLKGKKGEEEIGNSILAEAKKALEKEFDVVIAQKQIGRILEFNFEDAIASLKAPSSYSFQKSLVKNNYKKISPYPFVLRDLAVFVPEKTKADEISDLITKSGAGSLLVKVRLFDVFKKDGRISYAFNLVFQSQNKTLSDTEVNVLMEGISIKMKESGWQIR